MSPRVGGRYYVGCRDAGSRSPYPWNGILQGVVKLRTQLSRLILFDITVFGLLSISVVVGPQWCKSQFSCGVFALSGRQIFRFPGLASMLFAPDRSNNPHQTGSYKSSNSCAQVINVKFGPLLINEYRVRTGLKKCV